MQGRIRTRVAIIGGGPSGLLLARKLIQSGIDCILLERRTRDYVLGRIRAGVLETGSVQQLKEAGVVDRLNTEGLVHDGCNLSGPDGMFRIDFRQLSGSPVIVYGQTEVTRDLYDALDQQGAVIMHECTAVAIDDAGSRPCVSYRHRNEDGKIDCDYVVGCDGYHGVARRHMARMVGKGTEISYPFGWLGMLSATRPVCEELIYSRSKRGFALASMRSPRLSRYYIQVPLTTRLEDWSDADFWCELRKRLPEEAADGLETGDSLEKSIAPLRTFVSRSLKHGKLLLCGDAGHIVPPTGAKGLNLAFSDVHYAHRALTNHYLHDDGQMLEEYSRVALARVWKATRFSWWMTNMLHRITGHSRFERQIQNSEFEHLRDSRSMQRVFAENYTGLPY